MNLTEIIMTKKGNSLTKYPSIPTYHVMGERGYLTDQLFEDVSVFSQSPLYVTEKIDGENTRILVFNGDYIIGSREDWVYAKGDRAIPNGQKKKVEFLKSVAEEILTKASLRSNVLYCFYGELHGYKIQAAWKCYTTNETYGFRLFDLWEMPANEVDMLLQKSEDELSSWRESNQQPWAYFSDLYFWVNKLNFGVVPFQDETTLDVIGTDIQDVFSYLRLFDSTKINLDNTPKKNHKAEGIVVRTRGRKHIFKLRFEDYERTLKHRAQVVKEVKKSR